jgi:threonine aldolase
LAAAGIYALENQIDRLAEDHEHCSMVADALRLKSWVPDMLEPETNILIFTVKGSYTPQSLAALLAEDDIHCMAISASQIRMVFHLDITPAMVEKLLNVIKQLPD